MKLSEYAKKHGCTTRTAWNHFKKGLIKNAYKTESGRIVIPDEDDKNVIVILYSGDINDLIKKIS